MCTYFSVMQSLNKGRMDPKTFKENYNRGVEHLKFSLELAEIQVRQGRHFLFEHPAGASSWKHPAMVAFIAKYPDLFLATADQCAFGLLTTTPDGHHLPAKKPIRFLPSSSHLAQRLNVKCEGGHEHALLKGGSRCRQAQKYTPQLCRAILEGFKQQIAEDTASLPQSELLHFQETPCCPGGEFLGLANLELWQDDPDDSGIHICSGCDSTMGEVLGSGSPSGYSLPYGGALSDDQGIGDGFDFQTGEVE